MKNKNFISKLPIETKHLLLKLTTTEDIDLILKMDGQESTQKFLGGIKNKTREERFVFLEKKENKHKSGLVSSLTVFIKDEKTPIAFIGLDIDENNNNGELSYIFDDDYTKKGYCTEASRAIINVAFNELDLNKIYADTFEGNFGSVKVLEKLGFKLEGNRKQAIYSKNLNKYLNVLDFGLLKEDFK